MLTDISFYVWIIKYISHCVLRTGRLIKTGLIDCVSNLCPVCVCVYFKLFDRLCVCILFEENDVLFHVWNTSLDLNN